MALRVWLPLNGNLKNQGIDLLSVSGTPTYSNGGKIGKGLSLSPRITFTNLSRLDNFTICFWLKVDSCTSDWADSLGFTCKQADGTAAAQFRFEATKSTRACSFHNNSPFGITQATRVLIEESQKGTWHHCCVSYNGANLYTYVDGSLLYTDTGLGGYLITDFHIGENNNIITGVMNDLRVYDECLSRKQIKEISKGLVRHYKLEGMGTGKNYIRNSDWSNKTNAGIYTFDGDEVTFHSNTLQASGISFAQTMDTTGLIDFKNKKLTFSMEYKITEALTFGTTNPWVGFELSVTRNTTTGGSNQWLDWYGGKTIPTAVTTGWVKYSCTVTVTNYDIAGLSVNFFMRDTTGTIKYRHPKIEIGEVATDWVPNSNDTIYSKLGFDNMLLTDVSGNGYNLLSHGDIKYNPDSPRYKGSTTFGDTTKYLYGDTINLSSPFTFNCWCYQTNATAISNGANTTLQFIMSQGRDTGFEGFSLASSNGYARLYCGTQVTGVNKTITDNTISLLNNWHMLTGTFDGENVKLYIDGVLKGTVASTESPSWEQAPKFVLGKMAYEYTSDTTYFPFVGSISNASVYATALSAANIKQLYDTAGFVDNANNMYAYEFKEE